MMLQVAAGPIQAIHRSAAIATYRDPRTWQWYGRLIDERQSGCSHWPCPGRPERATAESPASLFSESRTPCRLLIAGFLRIAYSRTVRPLGPSCLVTGRLQNDCIDTTHYRTMEFMPYERRRRTSTALEARGRAGGYSLRRCRHDRAPPPVLCARCAGNLAPLARVASTPLPLPLPLGGLNARPSIVSDRTSRLRQRFCSRSHTPG